MQRTPPPPSNNLQALYFVADKPVVLAPWSILETPEGWVLPAGPRGFDGRDGRDGLDGAQGLMGPQGPMGPMGPQGHPGTSTTTVIHRYERPAPPRPSNGPMSVVSPPVGSRATDGIPVRPSPTSKGSMGGVGRGKMPEPNPTRWNYNPKTDGKLLGLKSPSPSCGWESFSPSGHKR